MAEERTRPPGGRDPGRSEPPWRRWRYGPPWAGRLEEDGADRPGRPQWPWRSTLVVTVFVVVGTRFAGRGQPGREQLDGLGVALLVASALLLLWRWRNPVPVAFGTAAATLCYLTAGYPYGPVLLTVALGCFSAVVAGHRRVAWMAIGLLWVGHLLVSHWLYAYLPPPGDGATPWPSEIGIAAWALAVVAVSELVRVRREQRAKERAERAQAARRRADEERLRIARELHDVLAHSISVINVQAGVGLALLDSDPEQARTALTTIKTASKEALGEVRHVLDTLRAPGAAPRAPAPGLARLPELVDQAASAGLTVTVDTVHAPGAEPSAATTKGAAERTGTGRKATGARCGGTGGTGGPGGTGRTGGARDASRTQGTAGTPATPDSSAPTGRGDTATPPALPPGLDLACFRIIQEALTNVVRHSGSREARVQVRYDERAVRLRIDDDGPATGTDAGGSGKGLAGMRERSAALGGTIEAGPRPDGGFRVSAVLPRDKHGEDR